MGGTVIAPEEFGDCPDSPHGNHEFDTFDFELYGIAICEWCCVEFIEPERDQA